MFKIKKVKFFRIMKSFTFSLRTDSPAALLKQIILHIPLTGMCRLFMIDRLSNDFTYDRKTTVFDRKND